METLILILLVLGVVLILGVVMIYTMRRITREIEEIGDEIEKIGDRIQVIGKIFTGLVIGLTKASKEQRALTGKDLAEGLRIAEESKTTEELLEKLSTPELPEGSKEEFKKSDEAEEIK